MARYTLYGSEASYFTGKVRGYLRWKGVDFDEVASSAEVMKSVLLPVIGWPVIPVLALPDGTLVQDTADIITAIEAAHPEPAVMPVRPVQRFVSRLLQVFGDEWLTLPAMHYRWNHNEEWIYGEFGRSSAPDASPEQQYEIGKGVGQRFRGFVPMLGVSEATIPGIEASYEAFLAEFDTHLAAHPYVLGARPSFGDYALLGPLYAHLYRDPASGELMKRLAPRVVDWTERTIAGDAGTGELVGDDDIPATLEPILTRHLREHLPVLNSTAAQLAEWTIGQRAGTEVPRGVGMSPFTVEGCSGEMGSRTFSLFRLQAALDELAAMDAPTRERAAELLVRIGGTQLLDFEMPARLTRKNFKVALAG